MIIALLVVGLTLSMPVASVQAWGWRSGSKTWFTVDPLEGGMLGPPVVTPLGMVGDCIFEKHEFVWEVVASDARATVFNFNTMFWLWKEPYVDGVMWATRVIRSTECPTDPIIGRGYISGWVKDGIFTWKSVDYFDGYKVVSWSSAPMLGLMDIRGYIIET